jgi:alkanesulfonate monooxygenase SsuD/methylene tetrahydromethanopterin reductase-like flavin-dependent oxidoreductase (luciferase family)
LVIEQGVPMPDTAWGFGVVSTISLEVIREAARLAEELGYDSFWVNDMPERDGLVALADVVRVTRDIKLGLGVIPLTRRTPQSIIDQVNELRLPQDRLSLGIGSGAGAAGALQRVRDGVSELKAALASPIFISAIGPNMCQLAGEIADGVLFDWLTPNYAQVSANLVRQGAEMADRETPRLAAYVNVALGEGGATRLAREAAYYSANIAYGAHFRRMGVQAGETAVLGQTREEIAAGLAVWDGVLDEVVVRPLTLDDTLEQTLAIMWGTAPSPRTST